MFANPCGPVAFFVTSGSKKISPFGIGFPSYFTVPVTSYTFSSPPHPATASAATAKHRTDTAFPIMRASVLGGGFAAVLAGVRPVRRHADVLGYEPGGP